LHVSAGGKDYVHFSSKMKRDVTDRKDGKVAITVTETCLPRQTVMKRPSCLTHTYDEFTC
jgi:hypothetical protein